MQLNAIVAVEKGIKQTAEREFTDLHHKSKRTELCVGHIKTYAPLVEGDTEVLPPESKRVEVTVGALIASAKTALQPLLDIELYRESGNTRACADLIIENDEGRKLAIEKVPVTYLLFLEKQLHDMRKFVADLPVLSDSEEWHIDEAAGLYKSVARVTHRTKRVSKPIVLYPATSEHPAQTQLVAEDCVVGTWTMQLVSGAIPAAQRLDILKRIDALLIAVKRAREYANGIEVVENPVGLQILNFIF